MGAKLAYVAPIFEYPPKGGPELRTFATLVELSKLYKVECFFWTKLDIDLQAGARDFLNSNDIKFRVIKSPRAKNFLIDTSKFQKSFVFKIFRRLFLNQLDSLILNRHISQQIITGRFQIAWITFASANYGLISKLRKDSANINIVGDTDSVWSRFILRAIPFLPFPRKIEYFLIGYIKFLFERKLISKCDLLTAVSVVDLAYYLKRTKERNKLHLLYNTLPAESLRYSEVLTKKSPSVLISGSFGHYWSPMDFGTRWFLKEVWPIVLKNCPNASLHIVGKNSDKLFESESALNIKVHGFVSTIEPYLISSAVSVVPLWYESGTRFKILEASAAGVPSVSTKLGAEGLKFENMKEIWISDDAIQFAKYISMHLQFGYNQDLSTSLRLKIAADYGPAKLKSQLIEIEKHLLDLSHLRQISFDH